MTAQEWRVAIKTELQKFGYPTQDEVGPYLYGHRYVDGFPIRGEFWAADVTKQGNFLVVTVYSDGVKPTEGGPWVENPGVVNSWFHKTKIALKDTKQDCVVAAAITVIALAPKNRHMLNHLPYFKEAS